MCSGICLCSQSIVLKTFFYLRVPSFLPKAFPVIFYVWVNLWSKPKAMFCSMISDIKECEWFGFLIIPMVAVYSYMHCEAVEFKADFPS